MKINNYIRECFDGKLRLSHINDIERVVYHRISRAKDETSPFGHIPDDELTGPLVAAWFRETGKNQAGSYTGGQMPYQLVVRTDGQIDQCCRLSDVSPHAKRWSIGGIGVAFVGDFRTDYLTAPQEQTLEELVTVFTICGYKQGAHTSFQGGNKKCPGKYFDGALEFFLEMFKPLEINKEEGLRQLIEMGFEL